MIIITVLLPESTLKHEIPGSTVAMRVGHTHQIDQKLTWLALSTNFVRQCSIFVQIMMKNSFSSSSMNVFLSEFENGHGISSKTSENIVAGDNVSIVCGASKYNFTRWTYHTQKKIELIQCKKTV